MFGHSTTLLAALVVAAPAIAQETLPDDVPVSGIGREACATIIGVDNLPLLAQAGDWALGYLAGRVDAGQSPSEGATLSPVDPVDVVTGLSARCRQAPEGPVIDAVRGYAEEVFMQAAQGGEVVAAPVPETPEILREIEAGGDAAPQAAPETTPTRPRARPDGLAAETAEAPDTTGDG
ncbi:hypothetical protein E2L08_08940 [Palleronia sediminis]|uniref:Uncharacterized protein n=1 Tax=Palleronia sediminis TaxID=2547833 RepID=A0A4R6A7R1_9RHOB|nr:hypothetical protein [Palleronia sediminis]TDL79720.1 hypothetical protein E2L08_08940 [Palleronia sediminis]